MVASRGCVPLVVCSSACRSRSNILSFMFVVCNGGGSLMFRAGFEIGDVAKGSIRFARHGLPGVDELIGYWFCCFNDGML